jgi:hypothetical protein
MREKASLASANHSIDAGWMIHPPRAKEPNAWGLCDMHGKPIIVADRYII